MERVTVWGLGFGVWGWGLGFGVGVLPSKQCTKTTLKDLGHNLQSTSHFTRHTSHITHHTSHFTHHTSHVTCSHGLLFSFTASSKWRAGVGARSTGGLCGLQASCTSHVTRHTSHITRHTTVSHTPQAQRSSPARTRSPPWNKCTQPLPDPPKFSRAFPQNSKTINFHTP